MKKILQYSSFALSLLLALTLSLTGTQPAQAAGRCYVNDDAGGANNGTSWTDAYTDLQSALTDSCTEIWVAAGVYKPGLLQTDTFQLKNGVTFYGNFFGDESQLEDRHGEASILSGDIDGNDTNTDGNNIAETTADIQGSNSYHVVTGTTGAILDGFTITAGNANGTVPNERGGGMYNTSSSPTLANITFSGNSADYGGGMYNVSSSPALTNTTFRGNLAAHGGGMYNDSSSNPTLTDLTFNGNSATEYGGGMYNATSNPTIRNVTFNSNLADYSAGMHNENSSPALTNVTFSGNFADSDGGGMYNASGSIPTLTNVTFSGNSASNGGGMYNDSSSPLLKNIIIANSISGGDCIGTIDASSANNLIEDVVNTCGLTNGVNSNMVGIDPLLGTLGDYGGTTDTIPLTPGSFAIDAGNCTPGGSDQRGISYLGACDIGAYEYDYTGTYYVKTSASGTQDCQSWANACDLKNALSTSHNGDEIWVAAGVHKPGTLQMDTFQLVAGVGVYGGFDGTETARDQRDFENNFSILSGDIDSNDTNIDGNEIAETATDIQGSNSYHVVTGATGAILDGFTITAGNANGTVPNERGGGMYNTSSSPALTNITFRGNSADWFGGGMSNSSSSSPVLTNVTFSGNLADYGGGMHNESSSNPVLTDIVFNDNSATSYGGGMYNKSSSPTLTDVTFSNNSSDWYGGGMLNDVASSPALTKVTFNSNSADFGGGMYNQSSDPTLTNITISGNSADYGGGVYNDNSSSPTLINVTFSGNSADFGGGMFSDSSSPLMKNTIIANSVSGGDCTGTVDAASVNNLIEDSSSACGLANGIDGNIIGTAPLLGALGDHGGFTETMPLLPGSPAINTGSDTDCPVIDQRDETRPQGEHCDIGAYEAYIPTNDLRGSPKTISGIGYTDTLDTSNTTSSLDDPSIDACGIGQGVGTVWYTYTANADTAITFDTFGSDYDTFIAVWGDDSGLQLLACNNNAGSNVQSSVALQVTNGTTYFIEIGKPNE